MLKSNTLELRTHSSKIARPISKKMSILGRYSRLKCYNLQVSQLSQRDRVAGWVSFGHKWKMIFCRQ